jgi:hypothetical protein
MDWVDWYNTRRLLGSIGDIPPAEVEANHHAALEATPMANPGRFMAGAGARLIPPWAISAQAMLPSCWQAPP